MDRSLFEFSSHVVWHNTTHAGIMPYHMADWKISGALGTGRSEVNRTRVIDLQVVWLNTTWRFRASDWSSIETDT